MNKFISRLKEFNKFLTTQLANNKVEETLK